MMTTMMTTSSSVEPCEAASHATPSRILLIAEATRNVSHRCFASTTPLQSRSERLSAVRMLAAGQLSLDHDTLARSLRHLGRGPRLTNLFQRLQAGLPISIGVLGSSVAEHGGCIDQPGARCHAIAKAKGAEPYFVRLFRAINISWPHPGHEMYNGARPAVPPDDFLYCLQSNLPRASPHLVILEFGGMSRHLKPAMTELLVRRLLLLPSRPVLLFVTVREWCSAAHNGYNGVQIDDYGYNQSTPMARAERIFESFCIRYNSSCLSYWHALAPPHYAGTPKFTRADIAKDCLHPHSSRFGAAYLGDMLLHWFRSASEAVNCHETHGDDSEDTSTLPSPLLRSRRVSNKSMASTNERCYSFAEQGLLGGHRSRWRMVEWDTSHCNPKDTLTPCERADKKACPTGTKISQVQPVWFFCRTALVPKRGTLTTGKIAPGLVALLPGATLFVRLDNIFQATIAGAAPSRMVHVALSYLTSYEHMGTVDVHCEALCACDAQRIDAHQSGGQTERNESVSKTYSFSVQPAVPSVSYDEMMRGCVLRLTVLEATSSLGHKFKVSSLNIVPA